MLCCVVLSRVRVKVGGAWVSLPEGCTDGGLDIEWLNGLIGLEGSLCFSVLAVRTISVMDFKFGNSISIHV